jgi:uncharacterized membrane protein
MWALYRPILRALGCATLNAQLHVVRQHWIGMLLNTAREHQTFDAELLGHI